NIRRIASGFCIGHWVLLQLSTFQRLPLGRHSCLHSTNMETLPRRSFIKNTISATLGAALLQSTPRLMAGPEFRRGIRLGGPIFVKTDDPEELALAHRKLDYRAA